LTTDLVRDAASRRYTRLNLGSRLGFSATWRRTWMGVAVVIGVGAWLDALAPPGELPGDG
jgi:hypothetical protein